jgi:hypothetical protein
LFAMFAPVRDFDRQGADVGARVRLGHFQLPCLTLKKECAAYATYAVAAREAL